MPRFSALLFALLLMLLASALSRSFNPGRWVLYALTSCPDSRYCP